MKGTPLGWGDLAAIATVTLTCIAWWLHDLRSRTNNKENNQ